MATQKEMNEKILAAAESGDVDTLQEYICKGAEVNCQGYYGVTPLHKAVEKGNTKVVELLLKKGASPSVVDIEGVTPLHLAARIDRTEVVDLLKSGASMSVMNKQGVTPLHLAARIDRTEVVKLLINSGASLSVVDKQGATPLQMAAESGSTEVVELLLKKGASPSVWNKEGVTPLHLVAMTDRTEVVDLLLKAGASLSVVDNQGKTPLHNAAWSDKTEAVVLLLKSGASLSVLNIQDSTPLHLAAWYGRTKVVDLLLKSGASPSVVDQWGKTPLHNAACSDQTEAVVLLLKSGALPSVVNKKGSTPLHLAAWYGRTKVVDLLLKSGAPLSVVDQSGKTPLHWAVINDNKEVVQLLLKSGASLYVVDKQEKTPYVVAYGRTKDALQENSTLGNQFPMMDTSDETIKLLSEGTFTSYENCVYLGGACNVGKSTLASILIGEKIPLEWKSTDGLTIYFGRNGINLKTKEMVPLKQGSGGGVLSKVLRGKPIIAQKPDTTLSKNSEEVKPDTTLSKNREEVQLQDYDKENIIKDITLSTGAAPNPTPGTGNDDVNITCRQQSQENYIITTIQKNIKEEIRKGTYKIEIAPSDLVDFGGHRFFDMTHQLFMRHKGTFVLMFNGSTCIDFSLGKDKLEKTTEEILKHWVNSILSYCADDEDILPIILFCATHSDHYKNEKNYEERRKKLINDLGEIFKNHKLKHRIIYDDIFFINGMDENDLEINRLKSKLVEVAFKQESWGKRMPMAWVPLDLQLSELRIHNMNIISTEELITLNRRNEDLALTDKQTKDFLNVQHSLGKILYFDQHGLDNFIIVHPESLVNILRSFITSDNFWPDDEELKGILCTLTNTGKIVKQDLLKLWSQKKFHKKMPNDDLKEFIIQVLVHLDILVEPKQYRKQQESKVHPYLVPCIVKRRLPVTDFYEKSADKMICLSYTLLKSSIPAALSFKLIGAAMNVWPLKKARKGICLYHQAAILCIDESNDLHLLVEDDKVFVYLINKKNKGLISPNIASAVQECLTLTMTKVLEFYHKSFGKSLSTFQASKAFEIEVGEWCASGGGCYISVPEVKDKTEWSYKCKNDKTKTHNKTYPRYWIFDKFQKQVKSDVSCSGLDEEVLTSPVKDKHLFRLAEHIDKDAIAKLFKTVGLLDFDWKEIESLHHYDITVPKFVALCKWKDLENKKFSDLSFQKLSDAFPNNIPDLCQLYKEKVEVYDITNSALQEIPKDKVLQDLSKEIGNCAMHLGVELELSMATIEETLFRYPRSMFEQTFDVMKKWKISGGVKTIRMLMKAFQSVDGRGLTFFRDRYRIKRM